MLFFILDEFGDSLVYADPAPKKENVGAFTF